MTASVRSPFAATGVEYRLRFLIYVVILLLGFIPPWVYLLPGLNLTARSTWLILSAVIARAGWLNFGAAVQALLVIALLFTGAGAVFRLWGAAYADIAGTPPLNLRENALVAAGPYRRTRNPLLLGTLLHGFGVALLMPPAGAAVAIALLWAFLVRLALADEAVLAQRFGPPYGAYRERVPRFLPAPAPLVPSNGQPAHWGGALLAEIYVVGVFLTLAVFGWTFNVTPLYRGFLISLGLAIVVRAFLPSPAQKPA